MDMSHLEILKNMFEADPEEMVSIHGLILWH